MPRPSSIVALLAVVVLAVAACGSPAPADGPAGVVQLAVQKAAAKDLDGMRALACAGQEDTIRSLVGLPAGVGDALLPGVDIQAVMDAVRLDVGGVKVGEAVVTGDTAQVPVTGSLKVTFDAAAMRPIVERIMQDRGTPMQPAQLDALLQGLQDYGQDVPLNQQVRLVREGGAWKVCQQGVTPLPS